jgi:secreted trypsin-like serine protease
LALAAFVATVSAQQQCGVAKFPSNMEYVNGKISRQRGFTRIVGGNPARANSWPWAAALFLAHPRYVPQQMCGGTLVLDKRGRPFIVTAAHCFQEAEFQPQHFRVKLGAINKGEATKVDEPGQQVFEVEKIINHPRYNTPSQSNDIAVLKLKGAIKITDYVRPACLPKPTEDFRKGGENMVVAGWGTTSFKGSSSATLLEVLIKTQTNEECKRNGYGPTITPEMFCAGAPGKDSCQGDSGGPLITAIGNVHVLAGVVSFGIDCAKPGVPGVYAHVPSLVNWVVQTRDSA